MKIKSNNIKRAYCFDFDETLVTTLAKIHIYRNGVHTREMDSKEFNFYKHDKKDTLDFSDFKDPELILKAKKYKMWPVIENVNRAVKENRSTSDIYILTARSSMVKSAIYEFLKKNGIIIDIDHIITIGDDKGDVNISEEKHRWLSKIVVKYDDVIFFDDDPKNIQMASDIRGLRTRLVEEMGGVSAPMSTPMNTPGMGNPASPAPGKVGSGDRWDNKINKKPYTQAVTPKKKKKKKIVKEDMNERFQEKSDPMRDMGIGIKGLWDYTPEEAAIEIWALAKPTVQKLVSQAKRSGRTYYLIPEKITKNFSDHLAFEPDEYTLKYLTGLIQKEIDKSINDHTINLNSNVKYLRINESNLSPYDKIGMMMAKKLKVKPPFKKKKEKGNQNAIQQRTFEHQIITLDEFTKIVNESKPTV